MTGDESSTMNPWIAKAVILVASIVMVAIRAPHGQRSRGVEVVKNRKGRQEVVLLTLAWLGFFVPLRQFSHLVKTCRPSVPIDSAIAFDKRSQPASLAVALVVFRCVHSSSSSGFPNAASTLERS